MVESGSFGFHLYGLFVGTGIVVGFWVAARMAQKFSLHPKPYTPAWPAGRLNPNVVWDAIWWVFIPGLVGARLYHVLDFWEFYRENLSLIPAVWTGGLGIFGAVFGGLVGLWMFARLKELSFIKLADLLAFGLPVGQAIGRWGNYFNQEIYGKPTDLPWGIPISIEHRAKGVEQYTHFHPVFLYESIWSILTFGLLVWIWRKKGAKLSSGSYFSVYLVMYGSGRLALESLRLESWTVGGINIAKALGVSMVMVGVVYLYSKNR
jgi:phosphatidylglycerol:prolipoprotein diacylglycerol transferase